jgi:hypothetical protein
VVSLNAANISPLIFSYNLSTTNSRTKKRDMARIALIVGYVRGRRQVSKVNLLRKLQNTDEF